MTEQTKISLGQMRWITDPPELSATATQPYSLTGLFVKGRPFAMPASLDLIEALRSDSSMGLQRM